jgi:hypothetical protein
VEDRRQYVCTVRQLDVDHRCRRRPEISARVPKDAACRPPPYGRAEDTPLRYARTLASGAS